MSAKKFVIKRYPEATAIQNGKYWHILYMPDSHVVIGVGVTQAHAWIDAEQAIKHRGL